MNIFQYFRSRSNRSAFNKRCHGRRGSHPRQAASRTMCTFDHLEPRLAMAGDVGSLLPPPAVIAATTATPARTAFVRLADNSPRFAAPLSNSTITYGFNSEDVINVNWTVAGEWRIESTGIRLFGGQANLVSKQTFGPSVQKITFSYAITDNTQMWATLWGETFRLDPPRGGGQITATIERSGNAVTFSNGLATPVTVILKQSNAEKPTTLLIQMDQRNLWRPVMQLLLQSVVVTQNAASVPAAPTGLGAIPGNGEARLQWTSPAGNGGTPTTDYVVQYSSNGGATWTTFADGISILPRATVKGLTNGTSYVFRVAAGNSVGTGVYSANSASIRPTAPITVPTAPTGVTSTIGNGRVTIRWNPPASNGGRAITRYVVQYSANGGSTWLNATIPASTRTTASVLNLTNGVGYVFRVAAMNATGTGPFSPASASSTPVAGTRTTIDLAPYANRRLQTVGSGAVGRLPEGNVVLGGVNFAIPVGGNNIWTGTAAAGAKPRILDVAINAAGVTRVHTLINTLWGERDAGARASITFLGSRGARYTVELDGNNHIRDHLWNTRTNTINGTTTRNVFLTGSGQGAAPGNQVRLDMQSFTLPAAFATQTLTRIRIADWGGTNYQRLMVSGITVQ
jgi:hypothetical protein